MADPIELLKRVAQENGLKADPNDYLKRNQGNYTEALRAMLKDNDLALDDEEAAHKMFGLPVLSQTYIDENWKTDKEVEELSSRSNELFDKISKVKKGELQLSDIANIPESEIDEASKKRLFDNALTDYTKELTKINDTLAKNEELRSFGFNKVEKPPLGQRALSEVKRKIKEGDPKNMDINYLDPAAGYNLQDKIDEAAKLSAELNKEGTEDPVVISYQTAIKNGAAQAGAGKNGYVAGLGIMNDADAKLRRQLEMAADEVEKDPTNEEKKGRLELIVDHYKEQQNQFERGFGSVASLKKEEEAKNKIMTEATGNMNWLEKAKITGISYGGRMWHTTLGEGWDNFISRFKDESLDKFIERRQERGMAAAQFQVPKQFEGQPVQRYVEVGDKRFKVDQFGDIMYPVDKDMNPLNETFDKEAKEYDANRDKYGVKHSFSVSRLVGASTQVAINMLPIIVTNLGTSLIPGVGQVKGVQSIASIGASFLTMFNDNFERALQAGGSFDRAWNTAFITTLPQALIDQIWSFEARTGRLLGESVKRGLTKNLEDLVERYATKGTPQGFVREWFGALKRDLPGEVFEELAQDFTGAYMDYARNGIALEIDPLDEINMGLSLPFTVGTFSGVTTYLSTRKDQKRWKESMIAATMASDKSREFMQNAVDGGAMTKEEMDARLGVITENEAIVQDIKGNDRLSGDAKNKVWDLVAERALAKARANGAKNNTDREKYQKQADAITDDSIRELAKSLEGKKSNEVESPFNAPVTEEEIKKADETVTTKDTGTPQADTAGEKPQAAEPTEAQAHPTDTRTEQPRAEGAATVGTDEERKKYGLEPLRPTYRGTSVAEWDAVKSGKPFQSEQGFGDNEAGVTWVSDKKEYSEEYTKSNDGVLIEFKPEAIDKSGVESGQQSDDTGVRLGRGLTLDDVQRVTDAKGNIIYEATQKRSPVAEAEATPQEVAQKVEPKTAEWTDAGRELDIQMSEANGGHKAITKNARDFRLHSSPSVKNINEKSLEFENNGFAVFEVTDRSGQTHIVAQVGYNAFGGRTGSSIASMPKTDNLPSNINDILLYKAAKQWLGTKSFMEDNPSTQSMRHYGLITKPKIENLIAKLEKKTETPSTSIILGKSEYKKVGDVWSDAKGRKVGDKEKIAALERKILPDAEVTLNGKKYTRFEGDWYTDKDKKVNTPLSVSKLDKKALEPQKEVKEPAPKTAPKAETSARQEAAKEATTITTIKDSEGEAMSPDDFDAKDMNGVPYVKHNLGKRFKGEKGFKGVRPSESLFLNQGEKYGRVNLVADEDFIAAFQYGSWLSDINRESRKNNINPDFANKAARKYGLGNAISLHKSVKEIAKQERSANTDVVIDFRKQTVSEVNAAKEAPQKATKAEPKPQAKPVAKAKAAEKPKATLSDDLSAIAPEVAQTAPAQEELALDEIKTEAKKNKYSLSKSFKKGEYSSLVEANMIKVLDGLEKMGILKKRCG